MTEKTTNWTAEELAGIRKQRAFADRDAYERDTKGHLLTAPWAKWQGHQCPIDEHCSLCVNEARDCAAAIVGGFIGMGIEIREQHMDRAGCVDCGRIEEAMANGAQPFPDKPIPWGWSWAVGGARCERCRA